MGKWQNAQKFNRKFVLLLMQRKKASVQQCTGAFLHLLYTALAEPADADASASAFF